MPINFVGFDDGAIVYHQLASITESSPVIEKAFDCFVAPACTTIGGWIQELEGGIFKRDGAFIELSAQPRTEGLSAVKSAQSRRDIPAYASRVPRAVFGGVILDHFGHFLLETPARMWALTDLPTDIPWIFLGPPSPALRSYHFKFLELLGLPKSRIIVADEWLHVDELYIPGAAIRYQEWVSRAYLAPYQRCVVAPAKRQNEKIFLSRAHLDQAVSIGEGELIDLLKKSDWTIIRPEDLSPSEQIGLFRSKNLISGVQGSAFHISLFSPPGCSTLQICRHQGARAYSLLDRLTQADTTYLAATRNHELPPFQSSGPFLLDLEKIIAFFRERKLLGSTIAVQFPSDNALSRKYEAWWHYNHSLHSANNLSDPKRLQTSKEQARKALEILPHEHVFRDQLILQTQSLDGPEAALTLANEALAAYPERAKYHNLQCSLHDVLGHYSEALKSVKEAIRLEPDNLRYKTQLALQYYRLGRMADAAKIYESDLQEPEMIAYDFYLRSLIHLSTKQVESGLSSARKAVELAPDNQVMTLHLLNLFFSLGYVQPAKGLLQIYRRKFPSSPDFERLEAAINEWSQGAW